MATINTHAQIQRDLIDHAYEVLDSPSSTHKQRVSALLDIIPVYIDLDNAGFDYAEVSYLLARDADFLHLEERQVLVKRCIDKCDELMEKAGTGPSYTVGQMARSLRRSAVETQEFLEATACMEKWREEGGEELMERLRLAAAELAEAQDREWDVEYEGVFMFEMEG